MYNGQQAVIDAHLLLFRDGRGIDVIMSRNYLFEVDNLRRDLQRR